MLKWMQSTAVDMNNLKNLKNKKNSNFFFYALRRIKKNCDSRIQNSCMKGLNDQVPVRQKLYCRIRRDLSGGDQLCVNSFSKSLKICYLEIYFEVQHKLIWGFGSLSLQIFILLCSNTVSIWHETGRTYNCLFPVSDHWKIKGVCR